MLEHRSSAHPAEPIRRALADGRQIEFVEAYDCMTALLAQQTGFDGILVGAGAIANFSYGVPDVGLLDLPEVLEAVRRICECTKLPVIADVDDAGLTRMHVRRTVQLAERAGAAGIMVEDTDSSGSKLLWDDDLNNWNWGAARMHPPEVGAARIRHVVSSRRDPQFLVMARTDSIRVEPDFGLDGAIHRAQLYAEAGADLIYVLGMTEEQMTRDAVASVAAPIVFAQPGGIDTGERERLGQAGIQFLFHALVPKLSPYVAYKRTLAALKAAERTGVDGAPWEVNKQLLETLNLRGWSQLVNDSPS